MSGARRSCSTTSASHQAGFTTRVGVGGADHEIGRCGCNAATPGRFDLRVPDFGRDAFDRRQQGVADGGVVLGHHTVLTVVPDRVVPDTPQAVRAVQHPDDPGQRAEKSVSRDVHRRGKHGPEMRTLREQAAVEVRGCSLRDRLDDGRNSL